MAFLQAQGNIEPEEMARTFNCGIGMVLVVREEDVAEVTQALTVAGEAATRIGHIQAGEKGCTVRGIADSWSARAAWHAPPRSEERRDGKACVRKVRTRR